MLWLPKKRKKMNFEDENFKTSVQDMLDRAILDLNIIKIRNQLD